MTGCVLPLGSPSLLEAQSLSDAFDRLDPRVWSVFFAPSCNNSRELAKSFFAQGMLEALEPALTSNPFVSIIGITIFLLIATIIFGPRVTPPNFTKLFWWIAASLMVFTGSTAVLRVFPAIIVAAIFMISYWMTLTLSFISIKSDILFSNRVPLQKEYQFAIGAFFVTLSIAHLFLAPSDNFFGGWPEDESFFDVLYRRTATEAILWTISIGLLFFWPMAILFAPHYFVNSFSMHKNGQVTGTYVKKMGEWIFIESLPEVANSTV